MLGVNIDHVATIRQARGGQVPYPEPVHAALEAESAGADSITIHLRADRRHIQERDVRLIHETILTRLNVEIGLEQDIVDFISQVRPHSVCLVPEKHEELTTEGGLAVSRHLNRVRAIGQQLVEQGIDFGIFVEPDPREIEKAKEVGAHTIEIHTGTYAEARDPHIVGRELDKIAQAVQMGLTCGLKVNAGHGLHYHNVQKLLTIPGITEWNIGHAIIARSIFVGLKNAVAEMKALMHG